jgi:hypothetical protein
VAAQKDSRRALVSEIFPPTAILHTHFLNITVECRWDQPQFYPTIQSLVMWFRRNNKLTSLIAYLLNIVHFLYKIIYEISLGKEFFNQMIIFPCLKCDKNIFMTHKIIENCV